MPKTILLCDILGCYQEAEFIATVNGKTEVLCAEHMEAASQTARVEKSQRLKSKEGRDDKPDQAKAGKG
jgi:hypothetical protein